MLDSKLLRQDPDALVEILAHRGYTLDVSQYTALETERKVLQVTTENLQGQRNSLSAQVGQAKKSGEKSEDLIIKLSQINAQLKSNQQQLIKLQAQLYDILIEMPNLPHESVPLGRSESDNIEIRSWGTPRQFDYKPKDHVDLGSEQMNFELGAKLTGSRFVVLSGFIARLHRAIAQFMLDLHTKEHGYEELYVPYIVNRTSLIGTGQLPKFEDDQFSLAMDQGWYMIPTAEVPLTNIVRDQLIEGKNLPLKFVSHTPCFRREAGSYGRDTRGMIRMHQFDKVEMVNIVDPQKSYQALEELVRCAERVLEILEIPYRTIVLCTADMGFSAAKTYDVEAWLPSQNTYREISSCSNCEAFQARRLQARIKRTQKSKVEFAHTLNGSGLAVGRTLVAVLENYQQKDGSISIPAALERYMRT